MSDVAVGERTIILGRNVLKWRQRRGLSASALARNAGVSKSTISELERGIGNPSLDTIWSLANSLNVSLGSLLMPVRGESHEIEVIRRANAAVSGEDHKGYLAQLLTGWRGNGEIEISYVTLAEGSRRDSLGNSPGVVERIVCVEGHVEAGTLKQSTVLAKGDMLVFNADQPHFYHAVAGPGSLVVVQQYGPTA